MGNTTPVMFADRSDTRYTAASAQSATVIGRPNGWIDPTRSAYCARASGETSVPPAAVKLVYGPTRPSSRY